MDTIELGKRIKEARIAKKMTQSEVVGNFITRNMLSQIESGTAAPSVKTLIYLSKVLDLQLTNVAPGSSEDSLFMLLEAKACFKLGNYSRILEMESEYPNQLSDEFYAIFSMTYLRLSKEFLIKEELQKAVDCAQKSMKYSEKGLYANEMLKSESALTLRTCAERLSDYYKNLSKK